MRNLPVDAMSARPPVSPHWDEFDAARRDTVWRAIRALRFRPPGRAAAGDRRAVFNAALEQSEQLFAAAAGIDYAARPMLLFYGLSQAGRALAAASTAAPDDDWMLKRHGITTVNLDDSPEPHDLRVKDQKSGSFVRIAQLLGSASLTQPASLGQLWSAIPELVTTPVAHAPGGTAPVLRYTSRFMNSEFIQANLETAAWWFDHEPEDAEIAAALDAYPSLSGHHTARNTVRYLRDEQRHIASVWREWDAPTDLNLSAFDASRTTAYRAEDDRWVFPAFAGSTQPVTPLLLWWAILYTLSMLARYRPADWTRHLDVDSSHAAVPLETALGVALDTCPQLILHNIGIVSGVSVTAQ